MHDNIHGLGIDNHLMGLRYAAEEIGEPVPELFLDETYKIMNHFALSTSQVSFEEANVNDIRSKKGFVELTNISGPLWSIILLVLFEL